MNEFELRFETNAEAVNTSLKSIANTLEEINNSINKMSMGAMADTNNKIAASQQKVSNGLGVFTEKTRQGVRAAKDYSSVLDAWWQRFGAVAIGFTVAYRAMNAFENLLSHTSETIVQAIKDSGELVSLQSKLAMFTVMASQGQIQFQRAFKASAGTVDALAEASITAVSSIQELSTALDEVYQHGVVLGGDMMEKFASFVDFTTLIARTTGSTATQIRSEITGLMTGFERANNVLLRSLLNFRIISDEEIDALKKMTNSTEVFEKILSKVHDHYKNIRYLIMTTDVSAAMAVWKKSIRRVLTVSVQQASRQAGVGNIFASVFAQHAMDWNKGFKDLANNKDFMRMTVLMETLAKALDLVLTAFEKVIKSVAALATVYDNFSDTAKKVVKYFLMYEAIALTTGAIKLLAGAFVSLNKTLLALLPRLLALSKRFLAISLPVLAAYSGFVFMQTAFKGMSDNMDKTKKSIREFTDAEILSAKAHEELSKQFMKAASGSEKLKTLWAMLKVSAKKMSLEIESMRAKSILETSRSGLRGVDKEFADTYKENFLGNFTNMLEGIVDIFNKVFDPNRLFKESGALDDRLRFVNTLAEAKEMAEELDKAQTSLFKNLQTYAKSGDVENVFRVYDSAEKELVKNLADVNDQLAEIQQAWLIAADSGDFILMETLGLHMADLQEKAEQLKENLDGLFDNVAIAKINRYSEEFEASIEKLKRLYGEGTKEYNIEAQKLFEDFKKKISDISPVTKEGQKALNDFKNTINDTARSTGNWKQATAAAFDEITRYNTFEAFKDAVVNVFTSIEDAIVKMAETGKISFRDMAISILSDFNRILIRMSITKPIAEAFMSTSWFPKLSFADGGILQEPVHGIGLYSGKAYELGENGPEKVSPLGQDSGKVEVHIHNAPPGTQVKRSPNSNGGERIDVFIENIMAQSLATGKGKAVLGNVYGLTPAMIGR